jgi:hypothetical protein
MPAERADFCFAICGTSVVAAGFNMGGVGGASASKGQKSLTGLGFSVAGSSKRKQQPSDAHLDSEIEVVPDNADRAGSQLEPLSEAALSKFTVPYEFAVYQGVCTDSNGKQRHTFFCSVCNDGFPHKWTYPNEAARHAKISTTHKEALTTSRVAKTMRKSQMKQQQASIDALLSSSGKIMAIAAYMVSENIAWSQFPKVPLSYPALLAVFILPSLA